MAIFRYSFLLILAGISWYFGCVVPRDMILHEVMDCMEGRISSETVYKDCVEQVRKYHNK